MGSPQKVEEKEIPGSSSSRAQEEKGMGHGSDEEPHEMMVDEVPLVQGHEKTDGEIMGESAEEERTAGASEDRGDRRSRSSSR